MSGHVVFYLVDRKYQLANRALDSCIRILIRVVDSVLSFDIVLRKHFFLFVYCNVKFSISNSIFYLKSLII